MKNSLTEGNLRKIYLKYLLAGVGSSIIVSVYSFVDVIMVGQYEGSSGTAALAVVMPVWTIIFSLGLLFGVGGGVLFSKARGEGDEFKARRAFTASLITVSVVTAAAWLFIILCEEPLLRLFGADETLLPLGKGYMKWLRYAVPLFTFGQFFSTFIRNDNAPAKSMMAVVSGGVFNIIGDYVCVFALDMGIEGAGLATALGQLLAFCILCTHFFSRKNGLKLACPTGFFRIVRAVLAAGFSVFVVDLAMGVTTMLFNNAVMSKLGADALAVYGVIVNIGTFVQSMSYGTGQAAQPIISVNLGAGNAQRIVRVSRYGLLSALVIGLAATTVCEAFPSFITSLFMKTNPAIDEIAPYAIRIYAMSFILLPINVFTTYYFQAIMRPAVSLFVSLLRGIAFSALFIMVLPLIFGGQSLWFVMPLNELLTFIFSAALLLTFNRRLTAEGVKLERAETVG
jgi:MATE efflux family protein